jgi:2-dehydro-3-deoxygluconokinase
VKNKKVLCLGEVLLRLSPTAGGEWLRSNQLPVYLGGAELNVATALAVWQHEVAYFTAMPDHALSYDIAALIQTKGIDASPIQYGGNRIGLYYLQQGTDMKGSSTLFDRAGSSFATLGSGKVNWDEILQGIHWLHFSAIAPAVSAEAVALCEEVLQEASKRQIFISLDLNFRAPLWKYGKQPAEVMSTLAPYCNLIMGNIWAARTLLGMPLEEELIAPQTQEAYLQHATVTANAIMATYPACSVVANTFRFDAGEGILYYAALNKKEGQWVSPVFTTEKVIDKVGSGDCFMAGLIHGTLEELSEQAIIEYAAAAAFGKLQEKGDTTSNSVQTIQEIIAQHG